MIISIIVPVYNAGCFVVETLNSILTKVSENVEIIIVNDGSTDNSVELIEGAFQTELKLGKIKLHEQENAGVSAARNLGIDLSVGNYITFVDADDLLLEGYFEAVMSVIKSHGPDVVDIGFRRFSEARSISDNPDMYTYEVYGAHRKDQVIKDVFAASIFYTPLRIIKRSTLGDLRFPVGMNYCEDMVFLYQLYLKSDDIYHIKRALYGYRDNANGATRNMKPDYLVSMLELYQTLLCDGRPEIRYLKANVFYVIYRCCCELKQSVLLPINILFDSKLLACQFVFDKKIPLRKKMILFMPNIYQQLVKLKSYVKAKR